MHLVVLNINVNGQNMFLNYMSDHVHTKNDLFLLKKDIVDTVATSKQLKIDKVTVIAIHDTEMLNTFPELYITVFVTINNVPNIKDITIPSLPTTHKELATLKIAIAHKIEAETRGTIGDLVILGVVPLSKNSGVDLIDEHSFSLSAIAQ